MVIVSPASTDVHLGTNTDANRGLPAWRVRLKKGYDCQSQISIHRVLILQLTSQPMGLLLVLEISSISFQSRFATSARNLQEQKLAVVQRCRPEARACWRKGPHTESTTPLSRGL